MNMIVAHFLTLSPKNKKKSLWKNFLYFSEKNSDILGWNFPISSSKNFLHFSKKTFIIFWDGTFQPDAQKTKKTQPKRICCISYIFLYIEMTAD